jgi:hypothetical protein
MKKYEILGWVVGNNPFEALRVAGQMMVNEKSETTPVKIFETGQADLGYSQTVEFPENKLELSTAEQIIEWCVSHSNQPWVNDVADFLEQIDFPLRETTVHFVFINCKSGKNPVMTLTYNPSNQSTSVEKGWVNEATEDTYTCYVTEDLALKIIKYESDYQLILKAIMQNLDKDIRLL